MYFNILSFVICRIFRMLWNKKKFWLMNIGYLVVRKIFLEIEFDNFIWVVKNFSVWYIYKVILCWVEK